MEILLYQSDFVKSASSGLRLGRLLRDCGLINQHQLMDALEAQAATGARLGALLIKRGCLTQEQLALVLDAQDAIRTAAPLLDMSVMVGPSTQTGAGRIGFAVTLTKADPESSLALPESPVRTHQNLMAGTAHDLSIQATGQDSKGFSLKGACGATIPYQVSIGTGSAGPAVPLSRASRWRIATAADRGASLKLELLVDPADLRAVPVGRFCDTLEIALG